MNIPAPVQTSQSNNESLARAWDFFDQIYCISLATRSDRRAHARAEFARVGLLDRVEFVIVDKHPTDSEQGIFESHIGCLRKALDAGAQTIVVFEDDILFRRFSPERLSRSVRFMQSDENWTTFFFGCIVKGSRKTPFRSVVRVRYRCNAHAYAMRRSIAEKIVEQPWRGVAYDDLLRSMVGEHMYAGYPAFAFQSGSSTDNDKLLSIDRIRRLLGGAQRLQRWNEFSSLHWNELILGHAIFILLVICAVLLYRHG